MARAFSTAGFVLALGAFLASSAAAQEGSGNGRPAWGTPEARSSSAGAVAPAATLSLGRINASLIYLNASFGSGAVGLRNLGSGGLEVSGVATPVKAAFLYWAAITSGPPTTAVSNVSLQRLFPGASAFVNIAGVPVGTGASPCWSGDRVTVYRGAVPLSVATGNGFYRVYLRAGANGSTSGADPWDSSVPPLFEGAALVIVGTGLDRVGFYDRSLAGKTFFDLLTYQLVLPGNATDASRVLFNNIGADGQIGQSTNASVETASEVTRINNIPVAGPGSPANDSDWNGAIAGPLPQLFDNTRHTVTDQASRSQFGYFMNVSVSAPDDCLTPIANIVSVQ